MEREAAEEDSLEGQEEEEEEGEGSLSESDLEDMEWEPYEVLSPAQRRFAGQQTGGRQGQT